MQHRVSLGASAPAAALARRQDVGDALFRPLLRFSPLPPGTTPAQWLASHTAMTSALTAPLPPNAHILTTHLLSPNTLLLRLSHSYEAGEGGAVLGGNVSVDLAGLFVAGATGSAVSGILIRSCVETTLTGTQPFAAARKITYAVTGGPSVTLPLLPPAPAGPGMTIVLTPLSIRTFRCDVE